MKLNFQDKVISIRWHKFDGIKIFEHCMDPEEIVHDLVHMYTIAGNDALNLTYLSNIESVDKELIAKFKGKNFNSDRNEVKTSALTILVLEKYGFSRISQGYHSMFDNLGPIMRNKGLPYVNTMFLDYLLSDSSKLDVQRICRFLESL